MPRLFLDDVSFTGWFETDGDLQYGGEYYGYIGYRNQIIEALGRHVENLIVPEDTAAQSTDAKDAAQPAEEDCGC